MGQGDVFGIPDGLVDTLFGVILLKTVRAGAVNAQKSEPKQHSEPFLVEHERGLLLLFGLVKFQIVTSRFPVRIGLRSIICELVIGKSIGISLVHNLFLQDQCRSVLLVLAFQRWTVGTEPGNGETGRDASQTEEHGPERLPLTEHQLEQIAYIHGCHKQYDANH